MPRKVGLKMDEKEKKWWLAIFIIFLVGVPLVYGFMARQQSVYYPLSITQSPSYGGVDGDITVPDLTAWVFIMYAWYQQVNPIVPEYDYIVNTNGSYYWAEYGDNNTVAFSGTNASEVIQFYVYLGSSVYLSGGSYLLDTPIYVNKTGTVISGNGYSTILNYNGSEACFIIGTRTSTLADKVTNIQLRDLSIVLYTDSIGVFVDGNTHYSSFDRLRIRAIGDGTTGIGIKISGLKIFCQFDWINEPDIYNCYQAIVYEGNITLGSTYNVNGIIINGGRLLGNALRPSGSIGLNSTYASSCKVYGLCFEDFKTALYVDVNSGYNRFDCRFERNDVTINVSGYQNYFTGSMTNCIVAKVTDTGLRNIFENMNGYRTEYMSTGTFPNGNKSFSFQHYMDVTPVYIEITWRSDIGGKSWYWSANSTHITITLSANAGDNYLFTWYARGCYYF